MRSSWLTAGCLHSWIPSSLLLGGLLQGGALACNNSEQSDARPQGIVETPQLQPVSRNTSPASPANKQRRPLSQRPHRLCKLRCHPRPPHLHPRGHRWIAARAALPAVATASAPVAPSATATTAGRSAGAANNPAPAPATVTRRVTWSQPKLTACGSKRRVSTARAKRGYCAWCWKPRRPTNAT